MTYSQLQNAPPAFMMLASRASTVARSATSQSTVTLSGAPQSMDWVPTGQPTFPTPSQATTLQSYQSYPHEGQVGVPQVGMAALPPVRQHHPSTQSAQQASTPYRPLAKVPKSVSFGKGVIPAGAKSSYLNQLTYAGKASQPPPQGRESRCDAYEESTSSHSYDALRRKGKETSSRPQSQSGAHPGTSSSTATTAWAKRIVEVPQLPHEHNSVGWNRNVEHILDYFLYKEVTSVSPEERAGIVDKVLAQMDELDEVKLWFFKWEKQPLTFMAYLSEVVDRVSSHQLTEICLYTKWIRPGSYYHLQILRREELDSCPHLQYAGHPRPDVELPSSISLRTHRRTFELADANPQTNMETFRKARHNLWKSLTLHGKTQEAWEVAGRKNPSGLKPPWPAPSEEPQRATPTAPTHRGGDATSWATTMEKEDERQKREWEQPHSKSHKQRQEACRSHVVSERTPAPFSLQSDKERKKACNSLYEAVRAINIIQSSWIYKMIMAHLVNDDCTQGDVVQFSNLLLTSITEYHLTASVWPYSSVGLILPKEIDWRLPHISEYMPPEDVFSTEDVRLKDAKAAVMRLAAWLHQVEMYYTTDKDMAQSQRQKDHQTGPLLQYLLTPGCIPVTSDKVIDCVVTENLWDAHSQLQECKSKLRELKTRAKDLREVLGKTKIEYNNIHHARDTAKKEELKARKKILRKDIWQCEAEIEAHE